MDSECLNSDYSDHNWSSGCGFWVCDNEECGMKIPYDEEYYDVIQEEIETSILHKYWWWLVDDDDIKFLKLIKNGKCVD